jgi:hypothetical protein
LQALDKIRFDSLTDKSKLDAQPELFIRIVPDKANKTLSIIYSGVGMTKAGTLLCFTPFSLLTEFWMMLSSACHKNAELPLGKFLVSQSHFGMVAAARWIANLAAPCKVPCKILQL